MGACEVIATLLFINSFSSYIFNPIEPFFRKDYDYVSRQEGFFKLHNIPVRWRQAQATCSMEGAQLVYPKTDAEATLVTSFLTDRMSKETSGIWVGAHDIFAEGVYVNMEGIDLSRLYSSWSAGEPNDAADNEDCIILDRKGKLNDENCRSKFPFLCKKNLASLTANPVCETDDLAYVPNEDKSRCYKVHTTPKNWPNAYATCHAERSYLAIPNSVKEVNFLLTLLKNTSEEHIKVPYSKSFIGIGFHDLYNEGDYRTIHGESLLDAGYNDWNNGQPDNHQGNENCGTMTRQGKLNDLNCNGQILFICERDLGDPNVVDLYSRFQGN